MNSHASALRTRLDTLRDDVRDISARAHTHGIDIIIDPCATAAIEALYDAYASCIIREAREALEARREANADAVRSLTSGVKTFARAVRTFDTGANACKVWNLPSSVTSAEIAAKAMKMRVLRRVELGVAKRAASRAAPAIDASVARDDDAQHEPTACSSLSSTSPALLYSCYELIYPRRVMTQCELLRETSDAARSAYNAEHASATAQKIEIIDRLRSIDRRVRAAQKVMSRDDDSGESSRIQHDSNDALAEWWHSAAVRSTLRDDDDDANAVDDEKLHLEYFLDNNGRVDVARIASGAFGDAALTTKTSSSAASSNGAKAKNSLATLRAMMGDDVVDDSGDIDLEACDRRQTIHMFEDTGDVDAHDADGDAEEEDDEEDAGGAEFRAAAKAKRDARDARRGALRTEIRRLLQDASELTTAFDARVRALRDTRVKVEFNILRDDAWRARLAARLYERARAGDFNVDSKDDAASEASRETAHDDVDVKCARVAAHASRVDASARALDAARRAARTARRAFRRDVQDNPASRVHFDALTSLYETQNGISKHANHEVNATTTTTTRAAVFPQGLDDWWWDKLVSARAKRAALERDLRDAHAAHVATVKRMDELENAVREARERERERTAAVVEARRARRARAFDVECAMTTPRGYVEIPSCDTVRALERGDVVLISKSKIEALNASLRVAYAAKVTAESTNAETRADIERAKWDIQTLDLQSQDITARTTEVALLRVSKRLQQFLFHSGGEGTCARRRGRSREDVSEATARAARLHRNARLHEDKMARKRAILRDLCTRETLLRARVCATRDEISRVQRCD